MYRQLQSSRPVKQKHYRIEMLLPYSTLNLGDELAIYEDIDRKEDYSSEDIEALTSVYTRAENVFGIVVCLQGEMEVDWGGQTILLHRGDMMFFQSGTLGGLRRVSPDVRSLHISTREDFFKPQLTSSEVAVFLSEILVKPNCNLTEEGLQSVLTLYSQMKLILQNRDRIFYVRRMVLGLLQTLSFICLSIYHTQMVQHDVNFEKSHNQHIFQRFLSLVQVHYTEHREIRFYADKLCISPKYLSTLVYKASGKHASEHIDTYRLNEAKALLRTCKYNINEVSEMLSFNSPSHFCRYFKKSTGKSPMQFQKES